MTRPHLQSLTFEQLSSLLSIKETKFSTGIYNGDSGVQFGHMNDKQKKMAMKWQSDLSVTCMIKNRIGQHEVLLPINQNCYNFWKKKNRTNISGRDNVLGKRFFHFGNSHFPFFKGYMVDVVTV